MNEKKQILIVEDHHTFATTLEKIINLEEELHCIAIASNGVEAKELLEAYKPDICLLDIQLPDTSGIDILGDVKTHFPDTIFIMCTIFEDNERLFQSLKAGANGYILKSDAPSEIIHAIKSSLNGNAPMSSMIAQKVVNYFYDIAQKTKKLDALTPKENETLEWLSKGLLYKEIAENQNISIDTVKKHCGNIYKKLQVFNRTEALNLFFNQ